MVSSYWILLLVAIDLIFNSTNLIPYLARKLLTINVESEIFKCSLLTDVFKLEDEFLFFAKIGRHQ
jgi:hypothetical protein